MSTPLGNCVYFSCCGRGQHLPAALGRGFRQSSRALGVSAAMMRTPLIPAIARTSSPGVTLGRCQPLARFCGTPEDSKKREAAAAVNPTPKRPGAKLYPSLAQSFSSDLPRYFKPQLNVTLASTSKELEEAVDTLIVPQLLRFCPPEVQNNPGVTGADILKVFDEATEPLIIEDRLGRCTPCVAGLDAEGACIVLIQISVGNEVVLFRSWARCHFPENFLILLRSPGPEKKRFRFSDESEMELLRLVTSLSGEKLYKPSHDGWERIAGVIQGGRGGAKVKARLCYDHTKKLVEQHVVKTNADSKNLLKAGVAVNQDARGIEKHHRKPTRGCLELVNVGHFVSVMSGIELQGRSLKALTAQFTSGTLSKRYQISNWSSNELSSGQVQYAAHDAAVGADIFMAMMEYIHKFGLSRQELLRLLATCVDTKQMSPDQFPLQKNTSASEIRQYLSGVELPKVEECDEAADSSHKILDQSGTLLLSTSKQIASWYLKHGYAVYDGGSSADKHATLRLVYPPVRTASSSSVCAACGKDGTTSPVHILPFEYRQHLSIKSGNKLATVAFLAMCVKCHGEFDFYARRLVHYFNVKHGIVPVSSGDAEDVAAESARSAARVLVHAPPEKLGKEKIEKLRAVVASHVGCDVGLLRDKDIKNVGNVVQQSEEKSLGIEQAGLVLQKVMEEDEQDGLQKFVLYWKQYFIDMMSPVETPDGWKLAGNEPLGLRLRGPAK